MSVIVVMIEAVALEVVLCSIVGVYFLIANRRNWSWWLP
jgi:hypothetical protein